MIAELEEPTCLIRPGLEALRSYPTLCHIADDWGRKGVVTRYEVEPGMNHFTICDPLLDPDSAMTRRMVQLAKKA